MSDCLHFHLLQMVSLIFAVCYAQWKTCLFNLLNISIYSRFKLYPRLIGAIFQGPTSLWSWSHNGCCLQPDRIPRFASTYCPLSAVTRQWLLNLFLFCFDCFSCNRDTNIKNTKALTYFNCHSLSFEILMCHYSVIFLSRVILRNENIL